MADNKENWYLQDDLGVKGKGKNQWVLQVRASS